MRLSELAHRLGGTLHAPDSELTGIALDSRSVKPGQVFLAIAGARSDGHDFVPAVLAAGAVAAVVERTVEGPHIFVSNLVEALARFGSTYRAEFGGPVIGVTGSNGKTSTKEMLSAALSPMGPVLCNHGNQNTQYTSPLLWRHLSAETKSVVVEMGMRGFGEIAHLAEFVRPTHGVVTMIGFNHVEMVGSRQGICRAKGELLQAITERGFIWREDEFYHDLLGYSAAPVSTFGFTPDAEMQILGYRSLSLDRCRVRVAWQGQSAEFELPTIGRHQALNAAAAALVAVHLGVPLKEACSAITERLELPPMRLEIQPFAAGQVIMDAYNASPDSMVAAIKTLSEVPATRRLAVLGEMKELGDYAERGHRWVGKVLADSLLDDVLLYGEATEWIRSEAIQHGFSASRLHTASSLEEVTRFLDGLQEGEVALVKGSRALELERALNSEARG